MVSNTSRFLSFVLIIPVLLAAFWLRLDELDTQPPGISSDEAVNTVDALHIAQTGKYPVYEDPNRPEPLFRVFLAGGELLFGPSVWSFRFVSVLLGTLTVAVMYWTMGRCLPDLDPPLRALAGFAAAGALAVTISHITLTRSLYRAVPQPLFMLLFTGLLLRGLRSGRRRALVLAGISLGICLYTYTAALVIPAALGPFGLSLLIFRWRVWRIWLPRLIWVGAAFAVCVVPVGLILLDNPDRVLGRAEEVGTGGEVTLRERIDRVWDQFVLRGDVNSQYNADSAPLLPPVFATIFKVGLLALLIRVRQPSSALIAAMLALSTIPVLAGNEIPHGLRIAGAFAPFPLIIGAAVAAALALAVRVPYRVVRRVAYGAAFGVLAVILFDNLFYAHRVYADFWSKPYTWRVCGRDVQHAEWFFRLDKRDFGRWAAAQDAPLLIPVDELAMPTVRTWLMVAYPDVTTAGDDFQPPAGTQLVVPWTLELGDLRRDTRHYALLHDGMITLLPPLSAATHTRLLDDIDRSAAVYRPNGELLARVVPLPAEFTLDYEPRAAPRPAEASPLVIFDQAVALLGWRGPDTLDGQDPVMVTYTLDWAARRSARHQYTAFIQLQTADQQKLGGDDVPILRWLYPSTLWAKGDQVPDAHIFQVPGGLAPGAYRLAAGVYITVFVEERMQAVAPDGTPLGDSTVIGWIKVPQRDEPPAGEWALALDAELAGTFALRGARAERLDDGKIRLVLDWEGLADRPALDATIFVHALGPDGQTLDQDDQRPWGGQYPTFIWDTGERVRTEHLLELGSTPPGMITLRVGMYTLPDVARLPVIQDGQPNADGVVEVGPLHALLEN